MWAGPPARPSWEVAAGAVAAAAVTVAEGEACECIELAVAAAGWAATGFDLIA